MSSDDAVSITRAGAEAIDRLEPLWSALHEHHTSCAPAAEELLEFRTPPESWLRRRKSYEKWLAEPETVLLLAERDGRAVGYAVVVISGEGAAMVTGPKTAELESLAVLPEERGAGIGSRLLEQAKEHMRAAGVEVWGLGVLDGNDRARRFYERHGLRAFMTELVGRL